MAILKDENPREWAIQAARMDASYLISPRARQSAIEILQGEQPTTEVLSALVILEDGGSQQEVTMSNGIPCKGTSLDHWKAAAEVLGVFDNE